MESGVVNNPLWAQVKALYDERALGIIAVEVAEYVIEMEGCGFDAESHALQNYIDVANKHNINQ